MGATTAKKALLTLAVATILISTAAIPVIADERQGSWSPTGSLNTARAFHTETLLKDGRVLVAGGFSFDPSAPARPFFASAEIYNPHTRSWTETGSLATARAAHSATLLRDGRVLVAGGEDESGALASAEIYNPKTGTWSPTGSMNIPRSEQFAVPLKDGRVFVVGGENPAPTATAEIFDPKTGTWTQVSSMHFPRTELSAVMLEDGKKILVAGGAISGDATTGFTATATAEIYNLRTNTWTMTGSMTEPRIDYSMVVLKDEDDQVLVAGGRTAGSEKTFTYLNTAELFDPETGTWKATGSMAHPHGEAELATVVLRDGSVLIVGGFTAFDTPQANTELFNPETGAWTSAGSISAPASGNTAILLRNGQVLAVGGLTSPPTATNHADLFKVQEDED